MFEKFGNKCKNKHKVQIKLSKIQTCKTDLDSYSLTQWQFWNLTLKWLSGARYGTPFVEKFNQAENLFNPVISAQFHFI